MGRIKRVFLRMLLILSLLLPTAVGNAQDPPPPTGDNTIFIPMISADGGQAQARPPQQVDLPQLRLKVGSFVPAVGERLTLPQDLVIPEFAQGQRGYFIVQFVGPVQQAWKDQVVAVGAELLEYLPDFAFKVRMTPAQAVQVAQLADVAWVGIFQPAYKIDPDLAVNGPQLVEVRIAEGIVPAPLVNAIMTLAIEVAGQDGQSVVVAADAAQVRAIANLGDVAWITDFVLNEKHNEYGAGVILGANTANSKGFDGSTQTAAVADTGLGDGTANGGHPDIPAGRIQAIYNRSGSAGGCFTSIVDDGPQDVDSGHGTHVAGSVLSDGGANGEGKGTAPAARLVFQAIENWANVSFLCQILGGYPAAGYFLTGIPDDLRQLFQQAYDGGARVHANSWGAAVAGDYTADSAYADEFVWTRPDMTITFSAGNSGDDANNDGVVDNDSLGSPATAKNVITIGASENDRQGNYNCDGSLSYTSSDPYQQGQTCGSMGGNNILGTAGQRWGFTAEPLNSDVTAGNREQMAPFSSRGPTDDGRIKPDVVAPGTWVLSGYSSLHQEGYGDPTNPRTGGFQSDGWGMPLNVTYKYFGGTSMSNPLAAGAATVVRDYYQQVYNHNASAALVKATLINSAVDLLDENNDGADDNDFPIPNVHEGWGRIDLARATDGSYQFFDGDSLGTGGSMIYNFGVSTAGQPFKVTLVWSDYPSTESAGVNLVNDLDLLVTAPNGTQYRGNVFSGGWSQSGGSVDRLNNVENVYVLSAAAGMWTVQVQGYNAPNGPQPFALVVDGAFGSAPTPTPTSTATNTPIPTNTPTATNTPVHTPTNTPLPTETPTATNMPINTPTNTPIATETTTATSTPVNTATNTPVPTATATATTTNTPLPTNTPTSTPQPSGGMHIGDLDGVASPSFFYWAAQVTISVHDGNHAPVANANVSGSWSSGFGGSASCTTNSSGQCTVRRDVIRNSQTSVTYSVTNVTHSSLSYQSSANHDPDGDSNGTSIVINRP